MKRKFAAIFMCLALVGLVGCGTSIQTLNQNYATMSADVKEFAKITSQDWLFGSGIIQGALPDYALPAWVFDELKTVDGWAEAGEFSEWQLGYMIGVRFRLAGPIVKAGIEQYAPHLLGVTEVAAVLAFLGL